MNEEKGKLAWDKHALIQANENKRRELLLENMGLIHDMHANKLYTVILGDEQAPWSAYLGQHELFYTTSKIYMLDKIYEKFITELGLDLKEIADIPHSKLSNLIKVVTKDNVIEWLTKARELTNQDFTDELRVASGKESYLNCAHKKEVNYLICQSCGNRHKL